MCHEIHTQSCQAAASQPGAPGRQNTGRRSFIRFAALGGAAALVSAMPGSAARADGSVRALMLSCMDHRLVDDLVAMMKAKGLHDNYDHFVLAGASLGAVNDKFADWHDTFWQHLDVAVARDLIEQVIVVDHRDCGAFRLALGEAAVATPELETQMHKLAINEFALRVLARHPGLTVAGYLMALDGSSESVEITAAA